MIKHQIDMIRRLVITSCDEGPLTAADLVSQQAVWDNPDVEGYGEIFDFGGATTEEWNNLINEHAITAAKIVHGPLGIVVRTDEQRELIESYILARETSGSDSAALIQAFDNYTDAVEWVLKVMPS